MGEKLQRAISLAIEGGYQIDKEAFDLLMELSQTIDPIYLITEALKKMKTLPEKTFFIHRDFLEKTVKELFPEKMEAPSPAPTPKPLAPPIRIGTKKITFRAYARDVEADIQVIKDPTKIVSTTGSIEEYLQYFQDRFRKLEKILRRRRDVQDAIPISEALKASVNSKVKVIGIITEKREQKQRIFLEIEDLEAAATVLVPPGAGPEVIDKARRLLLDQVVCIRAIKGRNSLLIAENFTLPDIPERKPNKSRIPVYAVLMSDLHVGSKLFMEDVFKRFTLWLNGKFGDRRLRRIASHVKYIVIAGDIVDGVGVYPEQLEELAIEDVYKQYEATAELLQEIPEYVEVILIPGDHDASRKALPQPAIPKSYAGPLYEMKNIHLLGNPCMVRLHGVKLLTFHGRSLIDIAATVPDVSIQTPERAMKLLLQSRHLAPIYGKRTPIAPEKQDFMVIEEEPDILHAGHIHVIKYDTYRRTPIVNSGAWQRQTTYQMKMGLRPTPGVIPVISLQTLRIMSIDFTA